MGGVEGEALRKKPNPTYSREVWRAKPSAKQLNPTLALPESRVNGYS